MYSPCTLLFLLLARCVLESGWPRSTGNVFFWGDILYSAKEFWFSQASRKFIKQSWHQLKIQDLCTLRLLEKSRHGAWLSQSLSCLITANSSWKCFWGPSHASDRHHLKCSSSCKWCHQPDAEWNSPTAAQLSLYWCFLMNPSTPLAFPTRTPCYLQ